MGFLLSSILSKFWEKLAHLCSFIKLGTPPHFSFHKPWLTNSIGCPPTFTYHGWVPFLFLFSFFFERYNMEDRKSDHYVPMSWKQCHKMRSILKSFLKCSTWKFTWNGLQIPCIGIYSGIFEITWFLVVECMRSIPSQYRWRLAKDWERATKRAITAIIMHSDKTLLTKA
jgi:hypothetical protein